MAGRARGWRDVGLCPLLLLQRGGCLLLRLLLRIAGEGLLLSLLVLRLLLHLLLAYCLHHLHRGLLHRRLHLLQRLLHLRHVQLLVGPRVVVIERCWEGRLRVLSGCRHRL